MKLRLIKSVIVAASLLGGGLATGVAGATPNTSTYSMQVGANTVSVYETNSEAVNAAEADFTYSGATSSFDITASAGGTFTTCLSVTSASVACSLLNGSAPAPLNTSNLVATLTFTPHAGVTSGSVTVSMAGTSSVLLTADSSQTLNASALPSATYTYTAPSAPSQPAPTITSGTTSGSNSTSGSTTSANNSSGVLGNTTTNQSAKATTSNKSKVSKQVAPVKAKSHFWRDAGWTSSSIIVLALVAAGLYWVLRRRAPLNLPLLYRKGKKTLAAKISHPSISHKVTNEQSTKRTSK